MESRFHKAALGVFQHGLDLFACDSGEPFEEVVNSRAVFEILEKGSDRHARALEHPGAANFIRHAFDRWTLAPIKHRRHDKQRQRARQASRTYWLIFIHKLVAGSSSV